MTNDELTLAIKKIVHQELPNAQVFFFGSRVKNTHRPNSDIDILINASKKLTLTKLALLNDLFTESNLPFIIDLHDYHALTREFLSHIKNDLTPKL
jgi:predicted nucleotidyltransferase